MIEDHCVQILNNIEDKYYLATEFLQACNEERVHPISSDWINKIMTYADVLCVFRDDKIVAWLVLYCNNYKTSVAYCAGLRVLHSYRRQGLGQLLLQKAIFICKSRKFKKFTLYCNNPIAIKMYENNGFKILRTEREPAYDNEFMSYMSLNL